jgi:hypothetical protein
VVFVGVAFVVVDVTLFTESNPPRTPLSELKMEDGDGHSEMMHQKTRLVFSICPKI